MAKVSASQDASPSRARLDTETRPFSSPRVDESAWLVPTLTVLCHPQASRVGERAVLTELASGQRVELSRLGPLFAQPDSTAEPRPLADVHVSRRPLALVPGAGPGEVRLIPPPAGSTVLELDGEALARPHSLGLPELERGRVLMLAERVVLLLHLGDPVSADPAPADWAPSAPSELGAKPAGGDLGFVGESPAMARVRRQVRRVADLEVPILVRGPTGAGKELVAAALHRVGPRRAAPLIAVNMAAIPPELAAAELFGAEPGAFTGARRRRRGHFQRADRATLFLDEIGDAPGDVQALLLRALETGEVRPLGGESAERVDVRLIAATDAALEEAVEAGHFREPLLHRLCGYVIEVPALAERRDDIGRLLYHFLALELEAVGRRGGLAEISVPAPLVARLALFDWPGNVRQLRNAAREMVIESRGESSLRPGAQLARWLADAAASPSARTPVGPSAGAAGAGAQRYRRPSEIGDDELVATLRAHRWRLKPAAAEMGISRTSLYALIDGHPTLRTAADVSEEELRHALEQAGGAIDAAVDRLEVSADGLRRRLRQLDEVDGG